MIRIWNAKGEEMKLPEISDYDMSDTEIDETFLKEMLPIFASISQVVKTVITKIEFETPAFRMVIHQK